MFGDCKFWFCDDYSKQIDSDGRAFFYNDSESDLDSEFAFSTSPRWNFARTQQDCNDLGSN